MEPPPAPAARPPSSFPALALLPDKQQWGFEAPSKRIHDGPDVARFLTSKAYRDICVFVLQLNRALCPRRRTDAATAVAAAAAGSGAGALSRPAAAAAATTSFTLASHRDDPPSVRRLQALLDKVDAMVDDAPPDPGPRRFGNVAFRSWHRLLGERADALLDEALAPEVLGFGGGGGGDTKVEEESGSVALAVSAKEELKAYFLGGFGSSQRLDYGTGHELSFVAFLGGLWKLGAFADAANSQPGDAERSIVLGVIEPYLKVIRKLILTYTLEPAGSHGVWGLDDHSFVPYIFGSAQLTRPIDESEQMPLEGSMPRAPKPSDILKPETVEVQRELNMYFSAVGFINDVKKGPFWEHSPILFDVSGIKDGWGKINKGMIKMFNAEVLSKFPVVQHFPFGSLFSWDADPHAPLPTASVHMQNQPPVTAHGATRAMPPQSMIPPIGGAGAAAPWAHAAASRVPGGMGIPSVAGGRPPPPDPVERQVPRVSAMVAREDITAEQFKATKAPWA
ncbi:serine/threonine-protein phosphatase 2A activator 1 [Gaeumannomyces tritici R3-111a-1]|uniref:Serine/threonine-protein phosphatase 2A activator n=1 Tax=Gaeumannomyces tritici (strain R3-111a-1) TaxID=644352 RepID=J3P2H7_GAET3|nr:serine/threonine-protein phosphatase 2A activator 1 [Gaeumannomyces tritici R3-111a-1]EJT73869.1 serine/threonine-protein phosphatase 2A activator 1 [Gaeumannomyces tritici R3-111a-1]